MPNELSSNQLREWYKQFSDILLQNADIDVNNPKHLGLIKNFEITKWDSTNPTTPDVNVTYAYAPHNSDGSGVSYSKDADGRKHAEWLRENLKPDVTVEQIHNLYNMSRAGTLMINSDEDGIKGIQMVRTDPNGNIILSQPIGAYHNSSDKNVPEEDQIPKLPEEPKLEDYNIPSRPTEPVKPANMNPNFWAWLGDLLGMNTDYTKLKNYEKELADYQKKLNTWERDLNDKLTHSVTNSENGQKTTIRYDAYRSARDERRQFIRQLEDNKKNPMVKFAAIANSAAKLMGEKFWKSEQSIMKSEYNSTPRVKAKKELNSLNQMLRWEERTDFWVHNWLGHNGIPSRVKEWNSNFRVDNLQLVQHELPQGPGFDKINDVADLFDLTALCAISHPDIISKELMPGCTADETARIVFGPILNDLFTSARNNPTEYFKHIEPARTKTLEVMHSYSQGIKEPLGEMLAYGMRQLLREAALLNQFAAHTIDTTYLIGRLYNTLQQDPDLLRATGLKEEELQEARANMELNKIIHQGIQAKKDLLEHAMNKRTLSTDALKKAAQDVLVLHTGMLSLHDFHAVTEEAIYNSEQVKKLEEKLLDSNAYDTSRGGLVQGEKLEATPIEIVKKRMNLITSTFPANKFSMQLTDKNWQEQYKQAVMDKSNIDSLTNMNREKMLELFSKSNDEIFKSLMTSTNQKDLMPKAPTLEVNKQVQNDRVAGF